MQLELFFKVGYVCTQFPKGWRGTGLYSVCSPNTMPYISADCDEMGDYFAIEADTIKDIVRVT